jgi:voltage-gated potassium channel
MDQRANMTQKDDSMNSLWLLISLLLSLMVLPLIEGLYAGRALLLVGLTITFIFGAIASRSRLHQFALILLVVALPTAWATLFIDSKPLFVAHCILGSAFFWLVGGILVFVVIKAHAVTLNSVFDAICAYLLFGLAWALSYLAVYTVLPDSFMLPHHHALIEGADLPRYMDFSQFIYYSFVTMSTLGYGDMAPLDRVTRTLAWVQSVTGQFYVAVLIAWLVSALPRPGKDTS